MALAPFYFARNIDVNFTVFGVKSRSKSRSIQYAYGFEPLATDVFYNFWQLDTYQDFIYFQRTRYFNRGGNWKILKVLSSIGREPKLK
jgi:hypothetical protein